MPYLYITYIETKNTSGRYQNFSDTPTVTVYDGTAGSVIASPAPTVTNLGVGLYKLSITIDDLTDVLFQVVPPVADQAEIQDITTLYSEAVQLIDAAVSSRSSHSASDVWAVPSREITGGGGSAADIWSYENRTLTITPEQVASSLDGTSIAVQRGDTLVCNFEGLGNITGRTSLYLTVKINKADPDEKSLIQISESGGLLFINGGEGTSSHAGLAVTDEADGDITLTIKPEATSILNTVSNAYYDIQVGFADSVRTIGLGTWRVNADITRRIS